MIDKVGDTAGLVWRTLDEKGQQKFTALQRQLKVSTTLLHMALGWLAREDKIEITPNDRSFYVRLK